VPGTVDQVDLTVKVEEQSAGSLMFGVGYSQYNGIILSASVSQNNFLGTGDRFSIGAETSTFYKRVNASYVNPYLTDSGIQLGYNLSYSKLDYGDTDLANYTYSTKSFQTTLSVPISDYDSLSTSLGISSNLINTSTLTPAVLQAYQNAVGNKTIHSWTSSLGYTHDTRNSYWAPTRGGQLTASIEGSLPGSTVQFYKIFGEANHYWPIGKGFVLYLDGQVGYGKTYGQTYKENGYAYNPQDPNNPILVYKKGDKIDFPFWENYYAGGVRDVRGFQDNTLGPRLCDGGSASSVPDSHGRCTGGYYTYGQPVGGAFKVLGTAQVFLPLPFLKDVNTARVSWFVDVGNVYANYQAFKASELRASTGLSLQWQAPIGPLIINFAVPFRKQDSDSRFVERIQFTFGNTF